MSLPTSTRTAIVVGVSLGIVGAYVLGGTTRPAHPWAQPRSSILQPDSENPSHGDSSNRVGIAAGPGLLNDSETPTGTHTSTNTNSSAGADVSANPITSANADGPTEDGTSIGADTSRTPHTPVPTRDAVGTMEDRRLRAYAHLDWNPPASEIRLPAVEEDCRGGKDLECLRLAVGYGEAGSLATDVSKSDGYFRLAYSRLVRRCHRREPDACILIAKMHHEGRGVPRDQRAEDALVDRARTLCKKHPGELCPVLIAP